MRLDVRTLPQTREGLAYVEGGLFPVVTATRDGAVVAVLRGGAGHIGTEGRIEVVRSLDAGRSWTQPTVVADSDADDRNPGLGTSPAGTLVLAYHRNFGYDQTGSIVDRPLALDQRRPVEAMLTRSHDGGLTWERPRPLGVELLTDGSPYGKIVALPDGTLLLPIYAPPRSALLGERVGELRENTYCSYLLRSADDGLTWSDPTLVGVNVDETALLVLPDGDVLAQMRDSHDGGLWTTRSADGGRTWSAPARLTGPGQHPADMVRLADGAVLTAYGNRNPPYRVEALVSRDGGRSWLPGRLAFSGHLYGHTVAEPRPTDMGYPSTVVVRGETGARGVTLYYHNPSICRPVSYRQGDDGLRRIDRATDARYAAAGYRAVAVTWDEAELIASIDRYLE